MGSKAHGIETSIVASTNRGINAQEAQSSRPPVPHRDDKLHVTSQLILGPEPRVLLSWRADATCWKDGFRVMGFRSGTGFGNRDTEDFRDHGQMILEEIADGWREEHLPEGTHFYTFILYRRSILRVKKCVVRFSETIPSARTMIGRVEDQLKLRQLQEDCELHDIKRETTRNQAQLALEQSKRKLAALTTEPKQESMAAKVRRTVEAVVQDQTVKAMTRVELALALQQIRQKLERDRRWQRLDETQREKLLKNVMRDLNAAEHFFKE